MKSVEEEAKKKVKRGPMSEEEKEKRRQAQMGKTHSEESKRKMSEKKKEWWNSLTPAAEIEYRKNTSKGMRNYWKRKSKEDRDKVRKGISIGKIRNRLIMSGIDKEQIDEIVKEMRGE